MTVPIYNPKIPENPDASVGKDQINFLNNFSTLYNAFLKNHVALDASTDRGNHTIIELLQQTAQFQTDVGEISTYCKLSDDPTNNVQNEQIFLRYQGNQTEFQYTNYQIYRLEPTHYQIPYFTFLPGNLLIYFGIIRNLTLSMFGGEKPNDPFFDLPLIPRIAKKIIVANFCPIGTTPSMPPRMAFPTPNSNGIYPYITLRNSFQEIRNSNVAPNELSYFVVVNT